MPSQTDHAYSCPQAIWITKVGQGDLVLVYNKGWLVCMILGLCVQRLRFAVSQTHRQKSIGNTNNNNLSINTFSFIKCSAKCRWWFFVTQVLSSFEFLWYHLSENTVYPFLFFTSFYISVQTTAYKTTSTVTVIIKIWILQSFTFCVLLYLPLCVSSDVVEMCRIMTVALLIQLHTSNTDIKNLPLCHLVRDI